MATTIFKFVITSLLVQVFLFTPATGNAQRKSEEVLYAEFLDFIKSKGLLIENEYFNLVEKYGTLEKSFWLVGGRKYKIFCFSTTGNIKDLNSYVYDSETNELLAQHTVNHPLGINDFVSRERRRIRVLIKLQEHYNNNTTRMRIVIAYNNLPPEPQKIEETKPVEKKPTETKPIQTKPTEVTPIEKKVEPLTKTSTYTIQTLVEELNNTIKDAEFGFSEPTFKFSAKGEIDKNSKSIYFLEVNNKLYINYTIPGADPCGPLNRTIPAKLSGSTGSGSTYYYVKFQYSLACGINKYEGLYIYFKTKGPAYSDSMKEVIKEYSER